MTTTTSLANTRRTPARFTALQRAENSLFSRKDNRHTDGQGRRILDDTLVELEDLIGALRAAKLPLGDAVQGLSLALAPEVDGLRLMARLDLG